MNNFATLLSSLRLREIKGFEKHLKRMFRDDSIPIKISNYYVLLFKKTQDPPSLEIAFKKIFKTTAKSKTELAKLRNGLSDLFLELKEYLILEKFKERTFERDLIWMEILDEKDLSHQRNLYEGKVIEKLEGAKAKNIWHALEELKFHHSIFFRNNFQKDNPKIDLLQKGMEALEEFYQSMKMKLSAEMVNRKNLMPEQELTPKVEAMLLELKEKKINLENPSKNSELYFLLFKFFQKKNTKEYQRIKKYLIENNELLHQDEKLTILICLINYLATKIKEGNLKMLEETFNLYKFGLENKTLIYKGKIEATSFINIITLACNLGEYEWAENFAKENKIFLSSKIETEVEAIGLMIISFKKKNYNQVVSIYANATLSNIFLQISGRIHFLASLYELRDFISLEKELESFIGFLRQNKKVGQDNRDAALNFAKVLKNLYKRNLIKGRIQKEFEACNHIYFQKWLLVKISDYRQRE